MVHVRLCATKDIPVGDLKQFNLKGVEIIVVNLNDQFFCVSGRCTHAGAPLAEGELVGEILICPWHGSSFNIEDGSVLKGPATKSLNVYSIIVKDSFLFVEV